jgi:hypothetical protein
MKKTIIHSGYTLENLFKTIEKFETDVHMFSDGLGYNAEPILTSSVTHIQVNPNDSFSRERFIVSIVYKFNKIDSI